MDIDMYGAKIGIEIRYKILLARLSEKGIGQSRMIFQVFKWTCKLTKCLSLNQANMV